MGTIISTSSNLLTTQGNLFLPILADLAVYAVFRRARNYHLSELAGAMAGIAVGICLSGRTEFWVNLTGAGLYAAYKVIHYIYVSQQTSSLSEIELLERALKRLKNKVTHDCDYDVDATAADFDEQLLKMSKLAYVAEHIRQRWSDPALIHGSEALMHRAYLVILDKLRNAEKATELVFDQDSRNAEIAENLDENFYTAVEIFYETYRYARNMCYRIRLPNLQNAHANEDTWEFSLDITPDDYLPFAEGLNPKFRMKKLFHHVNGLLDPLLLHFSPEIDTDSWKIGENQPEEASSSEPVSDKEHVDEDDLSEEEGTLHAAASFSGEDENEIDDEKPTGPEPD